MPITKRDQNRIKELKKEIPFYGELSTSESKEKESYKRLVIDLKMELKSLEEKIKKVRCLFIPLFLLILSNPVWGIYKGKVIIRYPKLDISKEFDQPHYFTSEVPKNGKWWSIPDFGIGDWNCQLKRMDKLNDSYTIVLVRCYLGDNDPTESGLEELDTVNGFYFSISCKEGKNFSESHWLWSNGMKKEVVIYCNSF